MSSSRAIRAGQAFVEVGVRDNVQKALNRIRGQLEGLGTIATRVGGTLLGGGLGFLSTLVFPVQVAAQAEATAASFEVMLGSAEKAKKLLDELKEFGKTTPFEQEETNAAAGKLLAFGSDPSELTDELRMIGDIASGVGTPLNELADIYGKARINGRLMAEDVNQLTGRGIPIIQELAKQFGVADSEVRKLIEEGRVGFPQLEQAFADLTGEGGKFNGMMDKKSGTTMGRWSTIKDELREIAVTIGEALLPAVNKLMDRATAVAGPIKDWVDENRELIVTAAKIAAGVTVAGAALVAFGVGAMTVSATLGIAATAFGVLAGAVSALIGVAGFLLSPLGLVVGGLTALGVVAVKESGAAGEAADRLGERWDMLKDTAATTFGAIKAALAAGDFKTAAEVLWSGLKYAFTAGVADVKQIWRDIRDPIVQTATEIWFAVVEVVNSALREIQKRWIEFVGFAKDSAEIAADAASDALGLVELRFVKTTEEEFRETGKRHKAVEVTPEMREQERAERFAKRREDEAAKIAGIQARQNRETEATRQRLRDTLKQQQHDSDAARLKDEAAVTAARKEWEQDIARVALLALPGQGTTPDKEKDEEKDDQEKKKGGLLKQAEFARRQINKGFDVRSHEGQKAILDALHGNPQVEHEKQMVDLLKKQLAEQQEENRKMEKLLKEQKKGLNVKLKPA